jgi:hypothetical protein
VRPPAAHAPRPPSHPRSYIDLAIALKDQKRMEESAANFKKGLKRERGDAFANYNYGRLLKQMGDSESAVKHFKMAVRTDPTMTGVMTDLGNMLQGPNPKEAHEWYAAAARCRPLPRGSCRRGYRRCRYSRSLSLLSLSLLSLSLVSLPLLLLPLPLWLPPLAAAARWCCCCRPSLPLAQQHSDTTHVLPHGPPGTRRRLRRGPTTPTPTPTLPRSSPTPASWCRRSRTWPRAWRSARPETTTPRRARTRQFTPCCATCGST